MVLRPPTWFAAPTSVRGNPNFGEGGWGTLIWEKVEDDDVAHYGWCICAYKDHDHVSCSDMRLDTLSHDLI